MKIIQFGGNLGAMVHLGSGLTLHPRCLGEAGLPDDASEDMVLVTRSCIVQNMQREVGAWFSARSTDKSFLPPPQDFGDSVAAAASAKLGVPVHIHSIDLNLTVEDMDRIEAYKAEQRGASPAARPGPAQGSALPSAAAPRTPAMQTPPQGGPAPMTSPAPGASPGAPPVAAPGPAYGGAGAAATPPSKSSGSVYAIAAGAAVAIAVAGGLIWHFTHEHTAAPAQHGHGRH